MPGSSLVRTRWDGLGAHTDSGDHPVRDSWHRGGHLHHGPHAWTLNSVSGAQRRFDPLFCCLPRGDYRERLKKQDEYHISWTRRTDGSGASRSPISPAPGLIDAKYVE